MACNFFPAVCAVGKDWDEVAFNQDGQACAVGLLHRSFLFFRTEISHYHVQYFWVFLMKRVLKAHGWCVHVFLQLKDQLSQAEQMHSSELEGMRREISRLTQELHQRDITIASASGSTSDLEQQLRAEIERAERKAVEHRVKKAQDSYATSFKDLKAYSTILDFSYFSSFLLSLASVQKMRPSEGIF